MKLKHTSENFPHTYIWIVIYQILNQIIGKITIHLASIWMGLGKYELGCEEFKYRNPFLEKKSKTKDSTKDLTIIGEGACLTNRKDGLCVENVIVGSKKNNSKKYL